MSVEEEIEAVKFILTCFYDEPENEVQRNELIKAKVAENKCVKTYADFSKTELKDQLERKENLLIEQQKKENLLLAGTASGSAGSAEGWASWPPWFDNSLHVFHYVHRRTKPVVCELTSFGYFLAAIFAALNRPEAAVYCGIASASLGFYKEPGFLVLAGYFVAWVIDWLGIGLWRFSEFLAWCGSLVRDGIQEAVAFFFR